MVLRLEWKTLIHEVGGSRPVSGDSAPQIRGLDESASAIGQAKSPIIVGLAPGEVPQCLLLHESIAPPAPCVTARTKWGILTP